MQISGLSASNTFSATDVLAIEVNVNGVEKTYKLTGATLATALAAIGSYLKTADVVNNLTSTATTAPLSANMGKVLNGKIPINEIVHVSGTTDQYGNIIITITNVYVYPFCLTNVSKNLSSPYSVTVDLVNNSTHKLTLRIRNMSDNTVVGNTTVEFDVMIIGI